MKRNLLIGSIFSAIFLYLALRGIEWNVLWTVLKHTRAVYLFPAVALGLVSHFFRAYRWRFMLLPIKAITPGSLFSATMIGLMANNLLPARLGELVRAYVLGRKEQISRTAAFATIVYERIIDVFSLLALLWFVLARIPGPDWLGRSALWLLVANVLLLTVMIVLERSKGTVTRIVAKLSSRLPEKTQSTVQSATEGYLGGLAGMVRPRTLVPIVLTSALTWGFAMSAVHFCLAALGINLPPVASATLVVLIAVGSMIPSAPAYLGTTQYACVVGLGFFAIGQSEALAFSILFQALQFFPTTALGLYYLWKTGIQFKDITRR